MKVVSSLKRNRTGASLVELLVSVAVIGVAIAGVTDLLWLNTSWTSKFLNKSSGSYAIQRFLKRLGDDMSMAYAIDKSSTEKELVIWTPYNVSKTEVNPFPPKANYITDKVIYRVDADKIMRITSISTSSVLTGLVGPKKIATTEPTVFQYVAKFSPLGDPNFGITTNPVTGISSVIVNLEVANREYGKSNPAETSISANSDIAIRSEFMAKNELGMDP